jgi:hypothetical protein
VLDDGSDVLGANAEDGGGVTVAAAPRDAVLRAAPVVMACARDTCVKLDDFRI